MARPLKYDDQFTSILSESHHQRFFCFNLKVQRTAFNQRINLQQALLISSIFDFLTGLFIIIFFFYFIDKNSPHFHFIIIKNLIIAFNIIFALVGFDAALNLKKTNSKVYKWWRYFITLYIPLAEAYTAYITTNEKCVCYLNECDFSFYSICTFAYLVWNIYLCKISWSYLIRIENNHELLIIHGKYLEKMLDEQVNEVEKSGKLILSNINKGLDRNRSSNLDKTANREDYEYMKEKELLNMANTNDPGKIIDNILITDKNPFHKGMQKLNMLNK